MLLIEDVHVRFGGLKAIAGLDLAAPAGQVTGLIGPNGAGKTTTFNVITGLQRSDSGTVRLAGRDITRIGARRRARLGIGRTFQRLELFDSLDVVGNVLVALENQGLRGRTARIRAHELLDQVGLADVAGHQAGQLPTGLARLVELARALACEPKLLLLDEPSSGLGDHEAARLGDLIERLAHEGMAVLLVEHDMDMVMRICHHIQVLDFGRPIAAGTPEQIGRNADVQAAYLGTEPIGAVR